MVIGILVISAREFNKKNLDSFQNQILNITSRLQSGSTVSCTWLSRLESDNRLIIHIEDNGRPLLYHGSWTPDTGRDTLIMRAREAAMAERIDPSSRPVSSSLLRSSVFTVTGDSNDTYLGSVLVLPTQTGFQSLTLLARKDPMGFGLSRQGFLFLLLNLAGITALMSVSWVLVGKSLKPLAESQKQQNEFIAAASHELRAPLAVIRSSICAARTAPDQREKFMANIDRECSRMSCLVGDMLLLASADTGQWSLRTSSLDMDTLLISIYERFEPLYQDKGVCLKLELPEASLPRICGDENRLEQILPSSWTTPCATRQEAAVSLWPHLFRQIRICSPAAGAWSASPCQTRAAAWTTRQKSIYLTVSTGETVPEATSRITGWGSVLQRNWFSSTKAP